MKTKKNPKPKKLLNMNLTETGNEVYICCGTACLAADTQDKLKKIIKNLKPDVEFRSIKCLGRCETNYAFKFREKKYSTKSKEKIEKLFLPIVS